MEGDGVDDGRPPPFGGGTGTPSRIDQAVGRQHGRRLGALVHALEHVATGVHALCDRQRRHRDLGLQLGLGSDDSSLQRLVIELDDGGAELDRLNDGRVDARLPQRHGLLVLRLLAHGRGQLDIDREARGQRCGEVGRTGRLDALGDRHRARWRSGRRSGLAGGSDALLGHDGDSPWDRTTSQSTVRPTAVGEHPLLATAG